MTVLLGQDYTAASATSKFATGDAFDATGTPTYDIYEQSGSVALLSGTMTKHPTETGVYSATITVDTLSGFEVGKGYVVHLKALVDGVAKHVTRTFMVQSADVEAMLEDLLRWHENRFVKSGQTVVLYEDDGQTPLKSQNYYVTSQGFDRSAAQDA